MTLESFQRSSYIFKITSAPKVKYVINLCFPVWASVTFQKRLQFSCFVLTWIFQAYYTCFDTNSSVWVSPLTCRSQTFSEVKTLSNQKFKYLKNFWLKVTSKLLRTWHHSAVRKIQAKRKHQVRDPFRSQHNHSSFFLPGKII